MSEYELDTTEHVKRVNEAADYEIDPDTYVRITAGDLVKGFAQALQTGARSPQFQDRKLAANAATNGCIALVEDGNVIFDDGKGVERLRGALKTVETELCDCCTESEGCAEACSLFNEVRNAMAGSDGGPKFQENISKGGE